MSRLSWLLRSWPQSRCSGTQSRRSPLGLECCSSCSCLCTCPPSCVSWCSPRLGARMQLSAVVLLLSAHLRFPGALRSSSRYRLRGEGCCVLLLLLCCHRLVIAELRGEGCCVLLLLLCCRRLVIAFSDGCCFLLLFFCRRFVIDSLFCVQLWICTGVCFFCSRICTCCFGEGR